MSKIVYYVAATVDGYICALDGSIDGFTHDEEFVAHYQKALERFKCTIMGKDTYEFGYKFGLQVGAKAYPHMDHYVFSKSIKLSESSEVVVVRENWEEELVRVKTESETDIYLCGGSQFAGFVLDLGLIDEVILKINPFCLGEGKPLFSSKQKVTMELVASRAFECGVIEARYELKHPSFGA